ncbi:MAG: hypothetical protein GY756_14380 [bacterium]|nr:hypothetical protein [bacterium]
MTGKPILPGQKYAWLTVKNKKIRDSHGNTKHLCLCRCGNRKYYYGWQLRTGDSISCGCYKKENIRLLNSFSPRRKKREKSSTIICDCCEKLVSQQTKLLVGVEKYICDSCWQEFLEWRKEKNLAKKQKQ